MHSTKIAAVAIVVGLAALAAAPAHAQVQMDPRCSRAVEGEVRGLYPEAVSVEATALVNRDVSRSQSIFSGDGHFDDEAGNRTAFVFDCISSRRTGQAYGVSVRSTGPAQTSRSSNDATNGAPIGTRVAAPAIVEPAPQPAAPDGNAGAKDAAASVMEPPDEAASPLASGSVVAAPLGALSDDADCANQDATAPECSPDSPSASGEAASEESLAGGEAAPAPSRMDLQQAYDAALSQIAPDLAPGQIAVLRYAAHATTAASMCPTVELNDQAVIGTLVNVMQAMSDGLTPQESASRRDTALIALGLLTGQMLQEATADQGAFCTGASRNAGEAGSWSFIRVKEEQVGTDVQ